MISKKKRFSFVFQKDCKSSGASWSDGLYRPSDKQSLYLLQRYGVHSFETNYFLDEKFGYYFITIFKIPHGFPCINRYNLYFSI